MNVISPEILSQIEQFYHPKLSVYLEEEEEEEHVLTKAPRNINVGMLTHMIPANIIIVIILTSMVIRGHWRSIDF